ncbi:MAG: methylated-DNA--[protein]-cysteine S-methyltransferase [Calditrichaeota bacterium]|nr:methylated-DNA--[protein]-cysteine S-methyltransferase [Calditrichota bacterium]
MKRDVQAVRSEKYRRIWATVARIPYGKVATYGQIARLAGLGGHARMVGYALHATPEAIEIPWHRVINARGTISLPKETGHYDLQKSLLEAEGVEFAGERINLGEYRWRV